MLVAAAVVAGLLAGWLVGPMLVAVAAALAWPKHPTVPRWGRQVSLAVVGGVLAGAFRPSVVPSILEAWLPVVLVVTGTLLLSLVAGLLLARFAGLDGKTAALGTLPGAASGMLAMSDPLGADPRLVALMQYTRVVVVVVSAAAVSRLWLGGTSPVRSLQSASPAADTVFHGAWTVYALMMLAAALGAWAGTRLRLPAGGMLGPLLLGVLLEELGVLSGVASRGAPGRLPRPRPVRGAALRQGLRAGGGASRAVRARVQRRARPRLRRPGLGARRSHARGWAHGVPRHDAGGHRLRRDHGPR